MQLGKVAESLNNDGDEDGDDKENNEHRHRNDQMNGKVLLV